MQGWQQGMQPRHRQAGTLEGLDKHELLHSYPHNVPTSAMYLF